jgi:hypothetical protein
MLHSVPCGSSYGDHGEGGVFVPGLMDALPVTVCELGSLPSGNTSGKCYGSLVG